MGRWIFSYDGEHLGLGTTTYEVVPTPWDDLNWEGPDQSILQEGRPFCRLSAGADGAIGS